MLLIHYAHYDCPNDSDVQWDDEFPSACDGECPACGARNIGAVSWHPLRQACTADCNAIERAA